MVALEQRKKSRRGATVITAENAKEYDHVPNGCTRRQNMRPTSGGQECELIVSPLSHGDLRRFPSCFLGLHETSCPTHGFGSTVLLNTS